MCRICKSCLEIRLEYAKHAPGTLPLMTVARVQVTSLSLIVLSPSGLVPADVAARALQHSHGDGHAAMRFESNFKSYFGNCKQCKFKLAF